MAELSAYAAQDAGISQPIIYPLTLGDSSGSIDPGDGISFTYGVAGIGFLSAAKEDLPYQRGLSNVLKEQVNNSEQPGDQSFTNWWLRSQTDWSCGAGTKAMEPITESKIQRSYYDSYGVDVWTAGQVKLLKATELRATAAGATAGSVSTILAGTSIFVGSGASVLRYSESFTATTLTGITAGETVTGLAQGNGFIFVSTNAAVYMASTSASAVSKMYTFPESDLNARVFFAKDRLVLTSKGAIWDYAPPASGAATVALTYAGALYRKGAEHRWTSVAVAPTSILLGGSSPSGSGIWSMSLDTTGALPTLDAPVLIAEFPSNEELRYIQSYLGTFLAISTSLGVRVGTISNANVTYGPLIGCPVATGDFTAYDRFLYYPTSDAGETRSGCVRVDLSEIDETGRAAWAKDVRVPVATVGTVKAITVKADGAVVLVADADTSAKVFQAAATYESLGFLSTSDIRLGTTEKKYHDTLNVQLDVEWDGFLTVTSQVDDGTISLVGSVGNESGSDIDLRIDQSEPASKIQFGFTLAPTNDGTQTPTILSWQLKALPAVTRQRIIRVPLLCYDQERDHRGVPYGYEGYAVARWKSLEEQIRNGWPFTLQDLYTGETFRVVVESVSFTMQSPPVYASGFGGVIDLTVRVIG